MSEFHVSIVRLGKFEKHPNADTLEITMAHGGYPVIVKMGAFKEGDLAVYIPVDSIVPNTPEWAFLDGHFRIKARKLRGVFSMGMLAPAPVGAQEGDDVREQLGIVKYEPPIERVNAGGEDETDPGILPEYTDIEGLRRYPDVLIPEEQVILHEKTHGMNFRAVHDGTRLWVGSHHRIKKEDSNTVWWKVAKDYGLTEKLADHPNIAIYGEVYGAVQDLTYGAKSGELRLRIFDAMGIKTRRYFDYEDFRELADHLNIPTMPELYRGPWNMSLMSHAEGKTTIDGGEHVREGFVVRPVKERFDVKIHRCILKCLGEGYLLRKEK
jgi:RNA ligase (TIGR02306 family)